MWSKGAVVIVKRGDEAMASAIEGGLDIQAVPKKDVEALERDYTFLKRRDAKTLKKKIEDAEADYGHNWIPPKWLGKIMEGLAFIVYLISVFIDKYLVIK